MNENIELQDLYDDNFNKLDRTIRRVDEIPDGMNIMLSYALIKNGDKYLLEQSSERNDFKYALAGGHVLAGESPLDGLIRELKEELNIINVNINPVDTVKFPYNNYIFNIYLIEDKLDIDNFSYQKDEVVSLRWFSKEEILKLIEEDRLLRGCAYILKRDFIICRVRYNGLSFGVEGLTNGKVYDVLSIEEPFIRVIDDSGDDYLYSIIRPSSLDNPELCGKWEIVEDKEGILKKYI